MQLRLNNFNIDLIDKTINISIKFISNDFSYIKDNFFDFKFTKDSKDVLPTVIDYNSLPTSPTTDLLYETQNDFSEQIIDPNSGETTTNVYLKGIYKYNSTTSKWEKLDNDIYFGNSLINKCIEYYEQYKNSETIPQDETLDYSEIENYIGSVDYNKLKLI